MARGEERGRRGRTRSRGRASSERREGGQALLEFALVFPLLLLLALGIVQVAFVAAAKLIAIHAAFLAARSAVVAPDRPEWAERAGKLGMAPAAPRSSYLLERLPGGAALGGGWGDALEGGGPAGALLDRIPAALALTRVTLAPADPGGGPPKPGTFVTARVHHDFVLAVPLVNRLLGRPLVDLEGLSGGLVGETLRTIERRAENLRSDLREAGAQVRAGVEEARETVDRSAKDRTGALEAQRERLRAAREGVEEACFRRGDAAAPLDALRSVCGGVREVLERGGEGCSGLGASLAGSAEGIRGACEEAAAAGGSFGFGGGLGCEGLSSSLSTGARSLEGACGTIAEEAAAGAASVEGACEGALAGAEDLVESGAEGCRRLAERLASLESSIAAAGRPVAAAADRVEGLIDRTGDTLVETLAAADDTIGRAEEATLGKARAALGSLDLYAVAIEASYTLRVESEGLPAASPAAPPPPAAGNPERFCMHPAEGSVRCFSRGEVEPLPAGGVWRVRGGEAEARGLRGPLFASCSCPECPGWREGDEERCRDSMRALRRGTRKGGGPP